jgi:TetR/AcrR family transcriptional repressor of mexJK operon
MVSELLQKHPQSQLSEAQAYEASIDFFNLLKSDYHMRGILHLPYELTQTQQQGLANTVARKTIALLAVIT